MRKIILSTVIGSALLAGTAMAQSVNPGVEQLARIAGVSADGFTQAQLNRLIRAQRAQDDEEVNFVLSQRGAATRADTTATPAAGPGATQLAAIAGVEPGRFTAEELHRLTRAQRAQDDEEVRFVLSGENRLQRGGVGSVSAGKAQLAATLGLNPADYTLAELSALYAARVNSSNVN